MFLNNKQILQLLMPFLLGIILLFFQDNIVAFMHSNLSTFSTASRHNFYKNANEYLKIAQDMQIYNKILKKIQNRKNRLKWIVDNVLYQKKSTESEKVSNSISEQLWHLEAVFPKHNMAIINSQFVHKGSIVNKAKVMQVKLDRVLLKTDKGLKWIYLFR